MFSGFMVNTWIVATIVAVSSGLVIAKVAF